MWNTRTDVHVTSEFYGVEGFVQGNEALNSIELALLGDVQGKTILHLQCHFGMDSIALSRRGAKVCGVDFSENAIIEARKLATRCGADTRFIESDVLKLNEVLDEQFDIVFTSYGTIGWLPDLDAWAGIVQRFLKPGGKLVFAEFHPVVWMFDNDFAKVAYSYFNREMIEEEEEGTYADKQAGIREKSITWNHDLGEVLGALLSQGLRITYFGEYDYSPYACFKNVVEIGPECFQIKGLEGKIPMVYALVAESPGLE